MKDQYKAIYWMLYFGALWVYILISKSGSEESAMSLTACHWNSAQKRHDIHLKYTTNFDDQDKNNKNAIFPPFLHLAKS